MLQTVALIVGTLVSAITAYIQIDEWRRKRKVENGPYRNRPSYRQSRSSTMQPEPRVTDPVGGSVTMSAPSDRPKAPAQHANGGIGIERPRPQNIARPRPQNIADPFAWVVIAAGALACIADVVIAIVTSENHLQLSKENNAPSGTLAYNLIADTGFVIIVCFIIFVVLFVESKRRGRIPRRLRLVAIYIASIGIIGAAIAGR